MRSVVLVVVGAAVALGCSESHSPDRQPTTGGAGGNATGSGRAGASGTVGQAGGGQPVASGGNASTAGSGGAGGSSGTAESGAGGTTSSGSGGDGGASPPLLDRDGGLDASQPTDCDPDGDYYIAFTLDGELLRFEGGCGPEEAPGVPSGELFMNEDFVNDVELRACTGDLGSPRVIIDDNGTRFDAYDWRDLGAPGYVGRGGGHLRYSRHAEPTRSEVIRIHYTEFEVVGGVIEGTFDSNFRSIDSGIDLPVMNGEFRACRTRPQACNSSYGDCTF